MEFLISVHDLRRVRQHTVWFLNPFYLFPASDNLGDGLERFARGEKIKLSEQRKTYRERIQEIWERQRITLTEDPGDARLGEEGLENEAGNAVDASASKEIDDSDEDEEEDDDDFLYVYHLQLMLLQRSRFTNILLLHCSLFLNTHTIGTNLKRIGRIPRRPMNL